MLPTRQRGGINKVGFNTLNPGDEMIKVGKYSQIRSGALDYSKRNKMKIIALNLGSVNEFSSHSRVLIKRIK